LARRGPLPASATIALVPFSILLGVGGLVLVLILFQASLHDAVGFSDEALTYKAWLVDLAFVFCIIVFLPLLVFLKTRSASAKGFLVSSYVFGASTWLAGVLACNFDLGSFWLAVGLLFVGIGVVPLGIIGAMIYSDWVPAGYLFCRIGLDLWHPRNWRSDRCVGDSQSMSGAFEPASASPKSCPYAVDS
jgi:hypothetical protein